MKKGLLLLFCFIFSYQAKATHIVAGFSSYTHLSNSTYQIKFTLIRDELSGGAEFDQDITVQVYTFDGNDYQFDGYLTTGLSNRAAVDLGNVVFEQNTNIQLEYGEYQINYNLTASDKDYIFVFQRCCRNQTIVNIADPGDSGITLFTTITTEAQALQNSSIDFEIFPNLLAKVNEEIDRPIQVNNIDGDSLVFEFNPLYLGGGLAGATIPGDPTACDGVQPQGPCPPPYEQATFSSSDLNFNMPFPAWDNAGIDSSSGSLLGTPAAIGQYSYGFSIHEIRGGEIINSTNFDYIVYVADFTNTLEEVEQSIIEVYGNPSEDLFTLKLDNNIDFELNVYDINGRQINFNCLKKNKLHELHIEGPAGIYFLNVSGLEKLETIKLVKL